MNNLFKAILVFTCAISIIACGGNESNTESNREVINVSLENAFEAKATSFFIDELDENIVRFESMRLEEVRFNSEVEDINKEALDLFIQSMEEEVFFRSNEEFSSTAGEESDYKRVSNGYLSIGEKKYKAKLNYTNESSSTIQGVIVMEKPELVSFLSKNQMVIRIKGRQ